MKLVELILENKSNEEIMNQFGLIDKKGTEKLSTGNKNIKRKKCC